VIQKEIPSTATSRASGFWGGSGRGGGLERGERDRIGQKPLGGFNFTILVGVTVSNSEEGGQRDRIRIVKGKRRSINRAGGFLR